MEIVKVERNNDEYTVTIDKQDIEDLSEAFFTLFMAVQNEERVGNAWNYAMEKMADVAEITGEA